MWQGGCGHHRGPGAPQHAQEGQVRGEERRAGGQRGGGQPGVSSQGYLGGWAREALLVVETLPEALLFQDSVGFYMLHFVSSSSAHYIVHARL
jgi:hypothetical protein